MLATETFGMALRPLFTDQLNTLGWEDMRLYPQRHT